MSNGTPFTVEKIFALSRPRAQGYQVSMPALNLLSNRGSSKPGEDEINLSEKDDPNRACSGNNSTPNNDHYNYNKT